MPVVLGFVFISLAMNDSLRSDDAKPEEIWPGESRRHTVAPDSPARHARDEENRLSKYNGHHLAQSD